MEFLKENGGPEAILEACGRAMTPVEAALEMAAITESEFTRSAALQAAYRRGQLATDYAIQLQVIEQAKDGDAAAIKIYFDKIRLPVLPRLGADETEETV